jgi:hypothetical protein
MTFEGSNSSVGNEEDNSNSPKGTDDYRRRGRYVVLK